MEKDDDDEATDLLLSLVERCGLINSATTSTTTPPQSIAAALVGHYDLWYQHVTRRNNNIRITAYFPVSSTNSSITNDMHHVKEHDVEDDSSADVLDNALTWMLRHEELAYNLRHALYDYDTWIDQETMALSQELRQLEDKVVLLRMTTQTRNDNTEDVLDRMLLHWFPWIQSVVKTWQRTLWMNQTSWKQWQEQCFDTIYDDSTGLFSSWSNSNTSPLTILPKAPSTIPRYECTILDKVMLYQLTELLQNNNEDIVEMETVPTTTTTTMYSNLTNTRPSVYESTASEQSQDTEKSIHKTPVHRSCIINCNDATNLPQAVEEYFANAEEESTVSGQSPERRGEGTTCFVLVQGKEGSGKSFLCQQIIDTVQQLHPSIRVFHPSIPLDFLGRTVGGAELTWLNLLDDIQAAQAPFLVVLDSMDEFVPDQHVLGGTLRNRMAAACRHFLDSLSTSTNCSIPVCGLVLGTCTEIHDTYQRRFDRIFTCDNSPSVTDRESFFRKVAQLPTDLQTIGESLQEKLNSVVSLSLGKSYGDLMFHIRRVMSSKLSTKSTTELSPDEILTGLMTEFHEHCPPSVLSGADGLIDLQVLTASDLGPSHATRQCPGNNLSGPTILSAWKRLQVEVIIPLCRSQELHALMNHGGKTSSTTPLSRSSSMAGGALLHGPPACGKTTLAYEVARFATKLHPGVKLVSVVCTSLVHKEVGGSERALHELFNVVRQATPCIVLLEGIESIAAVRGHDTTTEGTMDRLLSTLLVELDGVDNNTMNGNDNASSEATIGSPGFAVIGTTHNPQWVDPALKRPGRLGTVIGLDLVEHTT
jgi:SpoVK/Ycf46/Vps4 family AAA+-type ATPase